MASSSLAQSWRKLIFFERHLVRDPEDASKPYSELKDLNIVRCCATDKWLCVGERDGGVHLLNHDWCDTYFRAYNVGLSLLCCPTGGEVLVTVGEDENGVNPHVKVWLLDKRDKLGMPFVVRCSKASPANRPVKVTSIAVDQALQQMAVGFEDSSLVLYKGDVRRERQAKSQLLRDGLLCEQDGAVVGLAFQNLPASLTALYAVTTQVTVSFLLGTKEKDVKKTILERKGCRPECWALAGHELQSQMVVGRPEGIHFYQPEERGGCKIFRGEKEFVRIFGAYLIVASRDEALAAKSEVGDAPTQLLTVYEIPNSFIAYQAPIVDVQDIVIAWDSIYVLTCNGKVYHLKEMDVSAKLDLLFRKNLFDLAINTAEKYNMDKKEVINIYRRYGDYFFQKGDYSNALRQYSKTIGTLETSYVIRKFLEVRRVDNLTEYLEAVFKAGLGTEEHANVLLNCYAKFGQKEKIDRLLETEEKLLLDVEDAVWTLRSSGFYEQAAALTRRCGHPERCLAVLMSDIKDFSQAVEYIKTLGTDVAMKFFIRYSKELMENVPKETMALLTKLSSESPSVVVKLIPFLVAYPEPLEGFLEDMVEKAGGTFEGRVFNCLLSLYLNRYELMPEGKERADQSAKILKFLKEHQSRYEHMEALRTMYEKRFHTGLLFLLEQRKMYSSLLRHLIELGDPRGVIDTLVKYCMTEENKYLWGYALHYFVRDSSVSEEYVIELLRHIQDGNIMAPMMVTQLLSASDHLKFSCIREYLLTWLKQQSALANSNKRETSRLQAEIRKAKSIVAELQNSAQIFQQSRCSLCEIVLEVPTVHFLCKHSFHQHCFENYSEDEVECPVCLPEKLHLQTACSAQTLSKQDLQAQFKTDLAKSSDIARTLAEYFAKGLFEESPKAVNNKQSEAEPEVSLNPFEDDDE